MVVLRSVMYTPANNYRMIEKAPTLPADVIVLDLEDSVPPAEKETARFMAKDSIQKVAEGGADVYVRVNGWVTGLTDEDLDAVIQKGLTGIVLPKTEGAEQVSRLEKKVEELEKRNGLEPGSVAFQLLIETAKGVVLAYEAAKASKRVNSLVFGAVDYTRDMRVEMTQESTFHARSEVAMVARAAGLIAIDNPWPAYADVEGFTNDTKYGRQLGYEGRMLIHPSQIEISHRIYTPSKEAIDYARKAVQAFEEGMKQGSASVGLEGKMIDWAVYMAQKDVLSMADKISEKDRLRQEKTQG